MPVTPGYTGYNKELNVMANTHAFIRMSTLMNQIEGWQSTRASVLSHLGIMLNAVSKLGERNFFSRNKRFGTHTQDGDEIFCDLGGEAVGQVLGRLTVALQPAKGEGTQTRNSKRGVPPAAGQVEGEEQGQSDQTLQIANAVSDLMNYVRTKDYTMNECYTQDSFEAKYNLKWEGSA
ncbi:coat protein [Oat golden stripe virus]|nr:coat protein [Oat golden stripe virus]CAB57874.1 coat protein [Oat golden stripe virus]